MGIFSKQRRIVVSNRYTHNSSMRNGGVMIRLTLKKLIILVIILMVLLVWAFFVGVLVGQGISATDKTDASAGLSNSTALNHAPAENVAPQLPKAATPPKAAETPPSPAPQTQTQTTQVQPQEAQPQEEQPQSQDLQLQFEAVKAQLLAAQNLAESRLAANAESSGAAGDSSGDAVIAPQELSFMSDLKGKPAPPDPSKSADDARQPPAAQTQTTPPRAAPQSAAANTGTLRAEDPAPKATTPPGPGIFDYQYQVAATSDLEGAKRLVSQLRADGLRASMVQGNKDGSKLYRVHVDFRGTPSDTNQLREQLSKFGINRVLLKTKVATQ